MDKRPGAKKREALTAKQERFVEEYLVDLNATQAAIRAGYSERTAYTMGHQTKNLPHIAAAIAARRATLSDKAGITTERVLAELAKIGFSDIRKMFTPGGNLLPIAELDDDAAACLSSVEVVTRRAPGGEEAEVEHVAKIKLWDKKGALVDIGKHLGMFTEKVELTGKDGGPIAIEDISNIEAARRIAFLLSAADRQNTKH